MQPIHPRPESLRIVIVEDNAATRKMLVTALKGDDHYSVVAEFGEGRAALTGLKDIRPDIVLVDLGLPDVPGLEIIRAVAADLPTCDTLVITTFGDDESIFSALEAGARGYLLKGVTANDLRRDVEHLRDGGSPLSPSVARRLLAKLTAKQPADTALDGDKTLLTARETAILGFISRGLSYVETAAQCKIASATVHTHLKNIYRKLEVNSKMEAVFEARRRKIIE